MYFCGLLSSRFYKETVQGLFLRYAYIFSMLRNLSNFLKLLPAWIGYHYSNLKICDQRLSLIKLTSSWEFLLAQCWLLGISQFPISSIPHGTTEGWAISSLFSDEDTRAIDSHLLYVYAGPLIPSWDPCSLPGFRARR